MSVLFDGISFVLLVFVVLYMVIRKYNILDDSILD
jgi:hypothetical protein